MKLSLAYPFDWKGLENFNYPLDENGIPRVYVDKRFGVKYNPVTVAQYGLFNLQNYVQEGHVPHLTRVEKSVHWFMQNLQTRENEIGGWIYDYDVDFYNMKAPWISGMAQGQGISLLLRWHEIMPDEHMLDLTKQAFRAFLYPVAEGGVVSHFPDGSLVFEEFPSKPPSLVLNGHIFALLGIFDYAAFWEDKSAEELFLVSVKGLIKNLDRYDTGYWNLYDLHPTHRLASPMYVKVHVRLLNILHTLTNDEKFRHVASQWAKYLANPVCRVRWLLGKIAEKIRLRGLRILENR